MKKLMYLPILMGMLLNLSCESEEVEVSSNLSGTWNGSYSGDDRGVWVVTVDSNGNVNGTATSSFTNDSSPINGKVSDNGALSATLGNTTDREFVGQLKENNEAIGTWIDSGRDFEGTWEGTKQ